MIIGILTPVGFPMVVSFHNRSVNIADPPYDISATVGHRHTRQRALVAGPLRGGAGGAPTERHGYRLTSYRPALGVIE
jgi:hypothetical protein